MLGKYLLASELDLRYHTNVSLTDKSKFYQRRNLFTSCGELSAAREKHTMVSFRYAYTTVLWKVYLG
ncbi:hypothetical protein EB796_022642 [Bugula neritina]|uniref:Uncharacterized protein n=1 Tax=Bugula neritina TaxID=10212 RepID=A0A7J7J040_BUGNE|nr:hypothetical protein EB796_022642 [Bugula neritina]